MSAERYRAPLSFRVTRVSRRGKFGPIGELWVGEQGILWIRHSLLVAVAWLLIDIFLLLHLHADDGKFADGPAPPSAPTFTGPRIWIPFDMMEEVTLYARGSLEALTPSGDVRFFWSPRVTGGAAETLARLLPSYVYCRYWDIPERE